MSLWSINDKFSSTALIYVAIIVGLTTYFFVFNVNNLTDMASRYYNTIKKSFVKDMKDDACSHWRQRGQGFEAYRPQSEDLTPSEWYLFLYVLRTI